MICTTIVLSCRFKFLHDLLSISTGQAGIGHMDTLKMRKFLKILSLDTPRGDKNLTSVPKNKKMFMTFKISNDVHTK